MKLFLPLLVQVLLPLVSGYRFSPSYFHNLDTPYMEEGASFLETEECPSDESSCEGGEETSCTPELYPTTTFKPLDGCGSELDTGREGYGAGSGMRGPSGCGAPDPCSDGPDKQNPRLQATSIAQNAAQVAKAANDAQMAAAQEAARQVKMQLADKALAAARAADAIMEGKQAIVDNYARELREAEAVVNQVGASLECSETNAEAAFAAAKEAESEAASFKALLDSWKCTVTDVEGMQEQANVDLEEKNQMLTAARARGEHLTQQVAIARQDYEQVKEAAYRAASAAVEARQKANMPTCQLPPPPPKPCGDDSWARDLPDEAPRAGGSPVRPRNGEKTPSSSGEGTPTARASCQALLELYRQRRRQQMRQRRQELRKKQKRARRLKGRKGREDEGKPLVSRKAIYDFVDGY
ncbi:uncharacterized protein [Drosophila bipectinata]|uniref:uncharacterized protein n=1 Tax=Drosophila bipectinata TaxID=42026 RepID=UPI001C893E46|nr:uncharacterized protein LOC108121166 [Drosophila bipectinata]